MEGEIRVREEESGGECVWSREGEVRRDIEVKVIQQESCGNRVQHDEAEIRGRTEFEKVQRAEERVTHHSDPT